MEISDGTREILHQTSVQVSSKVLNVFLWGIFVELMTYFKNCLKIYYKT